LTWFAPLGLRFRDVMSGALVGMASTSAYIVGKIRESVRAIANRKGVYVLHHAPSLQRLEQGEGNREFWDKLPPRKKFVIEVNDERRRFQPFQFTEQLPIEGIYKWIGAAGSPPEYPAGIPLYSSPVRSVPSGMAVVRADSWDASQDSPAAWAVIEVL